jgi:hypothetical protein
MAVIVEKRYGRATLIDCMRDRRLLLMRYNAAAQEMNQHQPSTSQQSALGAQALALWPAEILQETQAPAR